MTKNSRSSFYKRCQHIVDDMHKRINAGEFLKPERCCELYGWGDYMAFVHELRKQNADSDNTVTTPAIEWMCKSRFFDRLREIERKEKVQKWINVGMLIVAVASAAAAYISAYKSGIDEELLKQILELAEQSH